MATLVAEVVLTMNFKGTLNAKFNAIHAVWMKTKLRHLIGPKSFIYFAFNRSQYLLFGPLVVFFIVFDICGRY